MYTPCIHVHTCMHTFMRAIMMKKTGDFVSPRRHRVDVLIAQLMWPPINAAIYAPDLSRRNHPRPPPLAPTDINAFSSRLHLGNVCTGQRQSRLTFSARMPCSVCTLDCSAVLGNDPSSLDRSVQPAGHFDHRLDCRLAVQLDNGRPCLADAAAAAVD